MKKKTTAICLCVALLAIAIVNLSLAYFIGTDSADNVFTTSNVKIELIEDQRNDDASDLEDFEQGKLIIPAVGPFDSTESVGGVDGLPTASNYVDKIIRVNNLSMDSYVRVYIAIPTELDNKGVLHFTQSAESSAVGQWGTETLVKKNVEIDGILYNVYYRTYNSVLTKDEMTATPAYLGFYMDENVDFNGTSYTINGNTIDFDFADGVKIPVFAVGVQSAGFDNADSAVNAAFGSSFVPWTDLI